MRRGKIICLVLMVTISNDAQRRALLLCWNLKIVCPVMLLVKGTKFYYDGKAN
jgi:hypothetical protein